MAVPVSDTTCYLPNGKIVSGNVPCYSSTGDGYSHCCDPVNDICLDNGLCYSSWHGALWRRTCTDKNWESSYCSKYCQQSRNALFPQTEKQADRQYQPIGISALAFSRETNSCQIQIRSVVALAGTPLPEAVSTTVRLLLSEVERFSATSAA